MFTVTRSFAGAQDFACGLRRPQNGSSSIPTRSTKTFLNVYGYEILRWRSGFRLRAQTPAKRLKFDPDQVHQNFPECLRLRGPSLALRISPAGSDARKTAQVRSRPGPPVFSTICKTTLSTLPCHGRGHRA